MKTQIDLVILEPVFGFGVELFLEVGSSVCEQVSSDLGSSLESPIAEGHFHLRYLQIILLELT